MLIKKIVMVEPKSPATHVYSFVRLPRLGLPILGTIANRRGIDIRITIEEYTPVDFEQIRGADLLCISTITSTAPRAYALADRARAAGVKVVIGGPHVTFLADEALQHADWVIRGEADLSFGRFLDMLEGVGDPEQVPGLSTWSTDRAVHNPLDPVPIDLNAVPIPDFSLLAGNLSSRFDRGIIPVQTSRGCPHRCNFCSVTSMFGHSMRFASHEHVAEELERRRGLGRRVFFYDDNFCGSPSRTKSLLDYLLTRGTYLPTWLAQVSVRAAMDLELLKLMQRAGCGTVFVGFESISDQALALHNKRQTLEDIRLAIRRFHEHGIWVHGMFVTGSDAEGVESIRATGRFAIEEDLDSIQFAVLTPLPGTQVFEDMRRDGRLLTQDWARYDAHHAVFRPARMTARELTVETMAAMDRVYSPWRMAKLAAQGKFERVLFSGYAYRQVRRWWKENRGLKQPEARPAALACAVNPG